MKRFLQFLVELFDPVYRWHFSFMARHGLILGQIGLDDFSQGRVVNPGVSEAIRWSLYDHILYPQAGITRLDFFQLPMGQGITTALGAVVGAPKLLQDTNLQLQGQLPRFMDFRVELIEVYMIPGSSGAASTFTAAPIAGVHAAPIVAADVAFFNDVFTFYQSGLFRLFATDKDYLREAPLYRLPPTTHFGAVAEQDGSGTNTSFAHNIGVFGKPYFVSPPITLVSNQNFNASLEWPAPVPLPSTFNARVGVVLTGTLKRASQ